MDCLGRRRGRLAEEVDHLPRNLRRHRRATLIRFFDGVQ